MTYPQDEPRQPGRSDLSAEPGEGFSEWIARVRRTAVIDPEFIAQERRRMAAEDQQNRVAAERFIAQVTKASRWLTGSLAALGVSALLYFLAGLTGWIAVVCAAASVASLAAYALGTWQERSAAAIAASGPAPSRHQAVLLTELDETRRDLLERAQRAITEVLSSSMYRDRQEDRQADEVKLRETEWRLADRLRTLTLRQAQHDAVPVLGKETASVLHEHQRHLTTVENAVATNLGEIEALAVEVKRQEAKLNDQENAIRAARMDSSYQDLGASTAAVELATDEIRDMISKLASSDDAEPS